MLALLINLDRLNNYAGRETSYFVLYGRIKLKIIQNERSRRFFGTEESPAGLKVLAFKE
jgi:hypothetical protein